MSSSPSPTEGLSEELVSRVAKRVEEFTTPVYRWGTNGAEVMARAVLSEAISSGELFTKEQVEQIGAYCVVVGRCTADPKQFNGLLIHDFRHAREVISLNTDSRGERVDG